MEAENKIINSTFYEVTICGLFAQPNGSQKMSQESISVAANSFSEAETIALEQFGEDVMVKKIAIAPYKEVSLTKEGEEPTFFYKIKVAYFEEDVNTGKSEKHSFCYLVQSTSTRQAEKDLQSKILPYMSVGYIISSVVQTKLTAVIQQ